MPASGLSEINEQFFLYFWAQMSAAIYRYLLLAIICISAGCANITTPTGGKKDTIPPKLLSVSPADSQLNAKPKKIQLDFDEYITVNDAVKEVQISPILTIPPTVTGLNRRVTVKLTDTLLDDNTTYTISFGNAIKDLHEGNAFTRYTYIFSTGPYFDSLQVRGKVIDASTGQPAQNDITVELYNAKESDSAVVQHKPKYVTKADATTGVFTFKGLPCRRFRIYAIKDANGNLVYDGPPNEMVAFNNEDVWPGDTSEPRVTLRLFTERVDTGLVKKDTLMEKRLLGRSKAKESEGFTYSVSADTSNASKRTFDINKPITITFNKLPVLNTGKISLAYDSAGTTVNARPVFKTDTINPRILLVSAPFAENRLYTLKLAKGFAKDTSGTEVMPSRFVFRTLGDEDYGKIKVHLPTRFLEVNTGLKKADSSMQKSKTGNQAITKIQVPLYVLMVATDKDTIYQKPVTDTMIHLIHLRPEVYTFKIIEDRNGNGKWDTGDLLAKIQPEYVIPFTNKLSLKAGWENIVDFEPKAPEKKMEKPKLK
jgi:uncharacterized protein (DUF2141 family)